ncbi:hypothetical protein A2U01_0114182, partial [Trifolium medium]|nr:hypothetical protein [Trifolium medium]
PSPGEKQRARRYVSLWLAQRPLKNMHARCKARSATMSVMSVQLGSLT